MAHIVPSDIPHLALAGRREPELKTLDRLKRQLPTGYTVFHSVHWTREYKGYTVFGEADFIVVNRAGDALVIEQKNGRLEETGDGLRKRYDDRESEPFSQVRRSCDKIKEKFSANRRGGRRLHLDYLVYCPDHRVRAINAVGLDASRLIDAAADNRLASRIQEILGTGKKEPAHRRRVEEFFRQSFEIYPDIHAHIRAGERSFVRLSGGLSDILANIEMQPLRLRVRGVPGCGKTVVAQRMFQRAVERGKKPLLVCFNRPLAEMLRPSCPQGGRVDTWYGLCRKLLESEGLRLDFGAVQSDPDFWNKVLDRVIEAQIGEDWRFDSVIVDEGQDFEQRWFDILELFARDSDSADIVWLEDRDQGVRGNDPVALDEFVSFNAKANHRSPASIARFLQRALPFEFTPANDLPGLGVGVYRYENAEDQKRLLDKKVGDLLSRGFGAEDIVILSMKGLKRMSLIGADRVGAKTLKKFAGEYDAEDRQRFTEGELLLETVRRFKGQQAPAVIAIDIESDGRDETLTQRLLYTAFSRATVSLDVFVKSGDPLADRLTAAAQ